MAISIDWGTKVITVTQTDTDILTLVSGTLYEMDTLAFQQELKDWTLRLSGWNSKTSRTRMTGCRSPIPTFTMFQ